MNKNMVKNICLSPLISDGMVLQREAKVSIWGKAKPGEDLSLSFLGKEYSTRVEDDGSWEIILEDLQPGGPFVINICCGGEEKLIRDVYVGDVWVLGGQSNMELPVERTLDLFEDEVRGGSYPEIRQFTLPMVYDFNKPSDEVSDGNWISVTPDTVNSFSAVGYFFAKKIYEKYNIPIGFLFTAIGGTPAEAWISEETLSGFDRFQEEIKRCKQESYIMDIINKENKDNNQWFLELNQADEGLQDEALPWFCEEYDDNDWRLIKLPKGFHNTELEPIRGVVWLRKEICLPEHMAGLEGKLYLGTIVDADETYINGVKVGETGYLYPPRRYPIPQGLLRAGKNVITVRMILTHNIGGFVEDMPYFLQVGEDRIDISGEWKYKVGAITRPQGPTTFFQYKPTGVYNGMIYPLRNYTIRGALWYQGESNAGHPQDYRELFEAVISDWRKLWGQGDFPFYYVQLANYCPWRMEAEDSGWAKIREAQRQVMETANTGMAVIIDVGMYNDLHPWDKKSVGERLALWALNEVHGEDNVCSGPIYKSMVVEDKSIRLYFDYVGSGLIAKGDRLETFEICGEDGIFYPGHGEIDGDSILVSSKNVNNPKQVRYAWADNPEKANLYNKEGLPASPFITQS